MLPKKAKIIISGLLLSTAIGGAIYLNRPESSASSQSTDDAYIQADFTTVAPQVSGTVDKVLIKDNQAVKKGDLLATIDDRDFVVAVNAAKAQFASNQASINSLETHLAQQKTVIRQAQAALAGDDAALKLASENEGRYRNLAADGSGTLQALQQAQAQMSIQMASREKSQAGLLFAQQQVETLKADLEKARAGLALARASQDAAELKLSYTRIIAPIDGLIGQKSVRVGAFINIGNPMLAIIPLNAVYITANFRETQLGRVQAGQLVNIKVDALPGVILKGAVDSIGPASGVSYSSVAPHNATGNFTKIVQRLPVRIRLNDNQRDAAKLKVGLSVTVKIDMDN
jgi:membrane fusion protein (multidrug efflux system)